MCSATFFHQDHRRIVPRQVVCEPLPACLFALLAIPPGTVRAGSPGRPLSPGRRIHPRNAVSHCTNLHYGYSKNHTHDWAPSGGAGSRDGCRDRARLRDLSMCCPVDTAFAVVLTPLICLQHLTFAALLCFEGLASAGWLAEDRVQAARAEPVLTAAKGAPGCFTGPPMLSTPLLGSDTTAPP